MGMITYVHGDATAPAVKGPKIIAHIVNDAGRWGKGFVMAVSRKWPKARMHYLDWFGKRAKDVQTEGSRLLMTGPCKLGHVQLIEVIPHKGTSEAVVATAVQVGLRQGKIPVVCKDVPGFYVNRCLAPYIDESMVLAFELERLLDLDKAMKAMGFPVEMFTVLFALARTVGWVAQWNEMITDPDQKIGRPRQLYNGPAERTYVPMASR